MEIVHHPTDDMVGDSFTKSLQGNIPMDVCPLVRDVCTELP